MKLEQFTFGLGNEPLVDRVYELAKQQHNGQFRKYTGEPYFNHCIRVANRLFSWESVPYHVIAAALAHDLIEDTGVTYDLLNQIFGGYTRAGGADLVWDLTNRKGESHEKSCDRLASARRHAQLIKCADIYDNCVDLVDQEPDLEKSFNYLCKKRDQLEAMRVTIGFSNAYAEVHHLITQNITYCAKQSLAFEKEREAKAALIDEELERAIMFERSAALAGSAIF